MDVARSLHVGEDIILEFGNGLKGVGHFLVLLDVADDLGGFGAFGEVDEVGAAEDGGDAVFDEGEVGEVDACGFSVLDTREIFVGRTRNGVGPYQRRGYMADWQDAAFLGIRRNSSCCP